MLFNTFSFAIFLFVSFFLYVLVFSRTLKVRNVFLLLASYFFYACWNYKLLSVIVAITAVDYFVGLKIDSLRKPVDADADAECNKAAKPYLLIAILVNLGVLAYFKYTNFFLDSFWTMLGWFGLSKSPFSPFDIVLPVGISFYSFQGLSYVIDVYKGKIKASNNPVNFFTFLAFFPQLIAGPIERAENLLTQFDKPYVFNYDDARKGLLMIGIGLVKKMLIADRIAIYVDDVFGKIGSDEIVGGPSTLALILFSFQLYLDFSAYSQIAIGTARMFGFKLTDNFNRPYLSVNFNEFWSRWHITLTGWFRDYLYFPLGGNRKGKYRTYLNILIIFSVSGLWHGASWNFFIWGFLNGLFLILFGKVYRLNPSNLFLRVMSCLLVFSGWTATLAFFRGATFTDAVTILGNVGVSNLDSIYNFGLNSMELHFAFALIGLLMLAELQFQGNGETYKQRFYDAPAFLRWMVYVLIPLALIYFGIYGSGSDNTFIYFQF